MFGSKSQQSFLSFLPIAALILQALLFTSTSLSGSLVLAQNTNGSNFTLALNEGWNMISVNTHTDISQLTDDCSIAPGPWEWKENQYQETSTLHPLGGYWVYSEKNCKANIEGGPLSSASYELTSGWNIISSINKENWSLLNKDCTLLSEDFYNWDADSEEYKKTEPHSFMHPDKGYWVQVKDSCSIKKASLSIKLKEETEEVLSNSFLQSQATPAPENASKKVGTRIAAELTNFSLNSLEKELYSFPQDHQNFSSIREDLELVLKNFTENTIESTVAKSVNKLQEQEINSNQIAQTSSSLTNEVLKITNRQFQYKASLLGQAINKAISSESARKLAIMQGAGNELYNITQQLIQASNRGSKPLAALASNGGGGIGITGPCGDENWNGEVPPYWGICWGWGGVGWGSATAKQKEEAEEKEEQKRDELDYLGESCGSRNFPKMCTGPSCEAEGCVTADINGEEDGDQKEVVTCSGDICENDDSCNILPGWENSYQCSPPVCGNNPSACTQLSGYQCSGSICDEASCYKTDGDECFCTGDYEGRGDCSLSNDCLCQGDFENNDNCEQRLQCTCTSQQAQNDNNCSTTNQCVCEPCPECADEQDCTLINANQDVYACSGSVCDDIDSCQSTSPALPDSATGGACSQKAFAFKGSLPIPIPCEKIICGWVDIPLCLGVGYLYNTEDDSYTYGDNDKETYNCSIAHPKPEYQLSCFISRLKIATPEEVFAEGSLRYPPEEEEISCKDNNSEECVCPFYHAWACDTLGLCPRPWLPLFGHDACLRMGPKYGWP